MRHKLFSLGIIALILSLGSIAFGQGSLPDIGIQKNLALGIVKVVGEKKVVLETKDGSIDAVFVSDTAFKRLPPDNLSLKAATDAQQSDISVGDRVLIVGKVSDDKKTVLTKTVYLVKGSDIQAQQEKERQEWQRRGISGRVTEVDPEAKTITVEMRGITGNATTLKVSPKDDVKYLRYARTSFRFSDATESNIGEIKKDDMIRALGDRSEDGTSFKAEKILTGAFVTVAGKVKSVNVEKNEVTISDLKTKKDVTISVNDSSLMKKFPEETAQRMARFMMFRQQGGGGSGVQPPRRQGNNNQARNSGNSQGRRGGAGGGRRGGMGRFDINNMLNRFPSIKVSDLKEGEMIAVSSPKDNDPSRLTAIKLLAGVEPFITMQQMSNRRSGRRGVSGRLNIPGLNNVDF